MFRTSIEVNDEDEIYDSIFFLQTKYKKKNIK